MNGRNGDVWDEQEETGRILCLGEFQIRCSRSGKVTAAYGGLYDSAWSGTGT